MIPAADSSHKGLDALLNPRSLAVIGATERAGSVGRAMMDNLMRGGYRGNIYPVNPKGGRILGLDAYSCIEDIPGPVDLAVVMVPADAVVGVVEECGDMGVRSAVVISAGFKECGGEGVKRETALRTVARECGIAMMGPNCLGLINTGIGLNATFAKRIPKPGNISFLSQSGALGVYALEFAAANDIGIRLFASMGNKAEIHENHLLRAFAKDTVTQVILAYLEDFQAPEDFLELARDVATGPHAKRIVLLKAGNSRSGRRAAGSHTGALAEKTDFLEDLCDQYGIIRAATLEDMFAHALCLANQPLPAGPRLAVLTNAGGPAILAADEAERQGLSLPEPSAALRARLASGLPQAAGLGNPIDLLGDAEAGRYEKALCALLESPEVDSVLSICTPQMMTDSEDIACGLAGLSHQAEEAKKPVASVMAHFSGRGGTDEILDACGIPSFAFPEIAVRALAAAWRHGRWSRREASVPPRAPVNRTALDEAILQARRDGRTLLAPSEAQAVLDAFEFASPKSAYVKSPKDLEAASGTVGFPLVAKISSRALIHKADIGGVIGGIRNPVELREAYAELQARGVKAGLQVEGVLLQRMIEGGLEIMAGAHRHPHFGPLIAFGLGGTLVEAIGDVKFRRAPLTRWDAREMMAGIKAASALGPFRGRPARDAKALEDVLLNLSLLMVCVPEIVEVDLNPVFALSAGASVADARIILGNT